MAVTDWNEAARAELPLLIEAGVTSFKIYMAYDALRLADDQVFDVLRAVATRAAWSTATAKTAR
jgi:dihydropyrimidinase